MNRLFSSTSIETTLLTSITSSDTEMTVASGTSGSLLGGVVLGPAVDGVYPDQFTVALEPDTQNEEIIFIVAVSGDTFTIVRGGAGTSEISHTAGASVKHVLSSDDLNAFEAGLTGGGSTTDASPSSLLLMGG